MAEDILAPETFNIYWQLAENLSSRIELGQLDNNGVLQGQQVLDLIFLQNANPFSISGGPYLEEKLRSFYFDALLYKQRKGAELFGLGYPLLMFHKDGKWLSFPLLVSRFQLESNPQQLSFKLSVIQAPFLNPFLSKYLESAKKIHIQDIMNDYLKIVHPKKKDLDHLLKQISEKFEIPLFDKLDEWALFPGKDHLEPYEATGVIVKTGFFANFPALLTNERKNISMSNGLEKANDHGYGMLSLDPYQQEAFEKIQNGNFHIVEGTKGSGKTHLITHIISNALANKRNCLVLSSEMVALKELQTRLSSIELGIYSFLYQIGGKDDALLLDYFKSLLERYAGSEIKTESGIDVQLLKKEVEKEKRRLDDQFQSTKKTLIGDLDWTDLVARFLESNRKQGKEKLALHLNPSDFEFSSEEFLVLKEAAKGGELLFKPVENPDGPLRGLHPQWFVQKSLAESRFVLEKLLRFNLDRGQKLLERYYDVQSRYAEALFLFYDGFYHDISRQVKVLKDRFGEHKQKYGGKWLKKPSFLSNVGLASKRSLEIKDAQGNLRRLYKGIVKKFNQFRFFDYHFDDPDQHKTIEFLSGFPDQFEHALDKWKSGIPALIQDDMARLSGKTLQPTLTFQKTFEELEYDLERFVNELNQDQVFQHQMENKMQLYRQQQQQLEMVLDQLRHLVKVLDQFEPFYFWQKFFLGLPENGMILIRALGKVNPEDWLAAFESWYTNQALIKFNHPGIPHAVPGLDRFAHLVANLKKKLLVDIREGIFQSGAKVMDKLKKRNKQVFNSLFKKSEKSPLASTIVPQILEDIAACIPVILSKPDAISQILSKNEFLFDWILVEDAHNLHPEEIEAILNWGKKVVLFKDQEETFEERQLKTEPVSVSHLKYIHEWQPGVLFFGEKSELLYPGIPKHFNVQLYQLEGRYDQQLKLNEEEAQFLLRLLNDIEETPQRTFPKVGIICLTKRQRNLILGYLQRIKIQNLPGAERIRQLERNGISILCLSDLHVEQFDIMMICSTYGVIDIKGTVTSDILSLNHFKNFVALKRLIEAGKKHVYLVNSLPVKYLESCLDGNQGAGIKLLAGYLLFLMAIVQEDDMKLDAISGFFHHPPSIATIPAGSLVQEIKERTRLESWMESMVINGFQFPYLINKRYFFLLEGFLSNHPRIDYQWEFMRIQYLEEQGFKGIPLFSVNWWKNALEAQKKLEKELEAIQEKKSIAIN